MSMLSSDKRITRSVTIAAADLGRQGVSKGSIKPMKALAVGGASAISQYFIAAPINQALGGLWGYADAPYALDLLSEVLGVGTALYALEMTGAVSKDNAQVEGSKKGGRFGKSLMLAGVDVIVAELILSLLGNSIPLSSDPAANTGAVSTAPVKTAVKTYVK